MAVLLFFYNRLFVGPPVIILALLVVMDDDSVVVGTRPTIDIVLDAVALEQKQLSFQKLSSNYFCSSIRNVSFLVIEPIIFVTRSNSIMYNINYLLSQ